MKNIIYVDCKNVLKRKNVIFSVVSDNDDNKFCFSGTDTSFCRLEEEDKKELQKFSLKENLRFILDIEEKIPFYSIPFVDVFAADDSGYFAIAGEGVNSQSGSIIYYIDKENKLWVTNKTFRAFFSNFLESPACYEKLKSKMKRQTNGNIKIFQTRADAEKEFTIIDI